MRVSAFTMMALMAAVTFAGCLDDEASGSDDVAVGSTGPVGSADAEALWLDPQNTPHPAYNYPTMSSPAVDAKGWHMPIAGIETPDPVSAMEHVANVDNVTAGAGIAAYGGIAVVPGFGVNTTIVDIRDPTNPVVLSNFAPQSGTHRGATIIAYPDGRIVTAISTSSIIDVWDITDPTMPEPLPFLEPTTGSHKVGVVPGTPIVYNAASNGGGLQSQADPSTGSGVTEIFDLTNPEAPVHVQDFGNGFGCHHVYFWNNVEEDKYRAICAGIEYTQIWDTADPLNPEVIVNVPVHLGRAGTPSASASVVAFSHFAGLNQDGTVLLVGDEMGGGGLPPGCVGEARTPMGSVSTPIGAVWFYDVSDEENPELMGYYSPLNDPRVKDADRSCTAHHGRLVPQEGRDVIAMSFYGAGIVLIDFTDPMLPVVIDQFVDGSDTWETWYYDGYLFTGDLARGMDVLKLV